MDLNRQDLETLFRACFPDKNLPLNIITKQMDKWNFAFLDITTQMAVGIVTLTDEEAEAFQPPTTNQ